ncbi:AAA family ATPase [Phytohabitans aurantiacus]|uniref:AAA+ ATPase domain-containing protein n=1 Tax=Phytohabitans aurantiacus TaxID=3016789 RepID=A0ABQ5R412_9ACTN|nr:AAA family ATPase [Phytohabitans aurantiacus]GLI00321.1 hypothetical protein Pa4123_55970 [Phytohabitans aurantiacus]
MHEPDPIDWSDVDAPGDARNPFDEGTEEHAAWERQEAEAREQVRRARRRERLASATDDEYVRLLAREEAKKRRAAELAGDINVPDLVALPDFLAEVDDTPLWRFDGLWPRQGNIVLAAQYKAGKTTTVGNVLRSLADGDRFLGVFDVEPVTDGSIVLCDFEMPRVKLRDWLRRQEIRNADRIHLVPMRGLASTFDLLDDVIRASWVEKLRAAEARVWIVDCLGPILSSLGFSENENREVGRFLDALTATAAAAGVDEVLLVHHMGHAAERSRGASRLRDWPDAEWRLLRKKDDDNPLADAEPAARRFFSAFGRDVDVREGQLVYDDARKRLVYAEGSRRETAALEALTAVLEYIRDHTGASGRVVEQAVTKDRTITQKSARDALAEAVDRAYAVTKDGGRRAKLHTLTPAGYAKLAELTGTPGETEIDAFGERPTCVTGCGTVLPPDMVTAGYDTCSWCLDKAAGL